jgi:excisionase family DNA binding protein
MQGRQVTTMLTSADVKALINVDRSTIYRMAEQGRIPAIKVGRQWRFPATAVERWLVENAPETGAELAAMVGTSGGGSMDLRTYLPRGAIQAAVDLLADIFGVMILVTDIRGAPITLVANPCGYFDVIATHPGVLACCIEDWSEHGTDRDATPAWLPSHSGLLCARSFIRLGGDPGGMVIIGGIAPDEWPPTAAEQAVIAARVGVGVRVIAEHVDEVHHADAAKRQWILDFVPRIGQMFSRFANERSHLIGRLDAIAALASPAPVSDF